MASLNLQQNLSLGQTLSPQMQQSLHLLQAPVLELRTLVQQEMEINPVLEEPMESHTDETKDFEDEDSWQSEAEQLREASEDWKDYFSQTQTYTTRYNNPEAEERRQFLFESQAEQESLSDHLISQLMFASTSEEVLKAGEEIIGNLDEAGFLQNPLEEIAASTQTKLESVQKALELIQSFHPPGIAARDLRETLLIQLKHRGKEEDLEFKIVQECLNDLGRKRYAELAKKFGVTTDRIQEAANYISKLQPRPGSSFSPHQPQNIIQPEAAIIQNDEGEWVVQMNHDPMPRVRINDNYKDLLGQASHDNKLRDYLKEKIRSGKFLIKCLHQRQDTIESILKEIIVRQKDFLGNGISHLKPLTMNQVAQVVSVHETTVSRAIANKYVQTPWGILPIKFFFTHGYQTSDGEAMANTTIKEAISGLVSREDRKKPLSDSEIVQILGERGINLARRTVAKYRAELKILPSNLRKEL